MEINTKIINEINRLIKFTLKQKETLLEQNNKKEANVQTFKIRNYYKALDSIKTLKAEITDIKQVESLTGIGEGMKARIAEIITQGYITEIKDFDNKTPDQKTIELDKLQTITGIGPKKAMQIYDDKVTFDGLLKLFQNLIIKHNTEDIKELMIHAETDDNYLKSLTHHQLVGLKYYHSINERIPRDEIKKIEIKIKNVIHKLDPKMIFTICGSYRRQLSTSGDIDVLITHPDIKEDDDVKDELIDIIAALTKAKLLVDDLTTLGKTKYMGICKLNKNSKGRRIDIRFIAQNDYFPALVYFTGSKDLNTTMRAEALKLGYTINEYGIYKMTKKDGKIVKGDKIVVNSEEDLFKMVNMEYLEPEKR